MLWLRLEAVLKCLLLTRSIRLTTVCEIPEALGEKDFALSPHAATSKQQLRQIRVRSKAPIMVERM